MIWILLLMLLQGNVAQSLTPRERIDRHLIRRGVLHRIFGADNTDLDQHYLIEHNRVELYQNKTKQRQRKSDEFFALMNANQNSRASIQRGGELPLSGYRIALDAGHIGGEFSKIEDRHLILHRYSHVLKEGDLTLMTVKHIESELIKLGATVLLSRDRADTSHLPLSFEQWMAQNDPSPHLSHKQKKKIFKTEYLKYDRSFRAWKINKFHPDLTFIVHFDANNAGSSRPSQPSRRNYNFSYIPGHFMQGELDDIESRRAFKRLAETNALEESKKICTLLNLELRKSTGIKIRSIWDGGFRSIKREWYAGTVWMKQFSSWSSSGVYSRNLHLTRIIRGPLCYGESLVQNNLDEYLRLVKDASGRTKQVADAYVAAALKYLTERK